MNPALLYLRVSTARQANRGGEPEGYSLPAQREACARKASELGAEVVGEFVDAGASARSVDRPGLQALIERLADKSLPAVGYVIVHKLDRLARDRADDVSVLLAIRAAGAELVSVSEQIDATPAGMLLHGIMASIAEFYSRNLSEEAKKGLSEKAKRGGTIGYAPTGYLNTTERVLGDDGISREAKTVIPDPSRAPHISWAFAEYARGELSLSDLTVALAARGLTSRDSRAAGKALSRASVHRMLSNPYYVGKVVHRGVQYDGKHEPLVDPATFAKVQDMLAGRKIAGDRAWRRTHYLKGTVVCARCGSRLGYSHNRGSGGVYEYFFCLGRAKKRTDCDLPYLSAAGVEDGVLALWQRQTLTPDDVERARRAADMELAAMTTRQSRDLRAARGDVERLTATKQRLLDAYLAEALTLTDFQAKQSDLAAQLTSAQSRLDDLPRTPTASPCGSSWCSPSWPEQASSMRRAQTMPGDCSTMLSSPASPSDSTTRLTDSRTRWSRRWWRWRMRAAWGRPRTTVLCSLTWRYRPHRRPTRARQACTGPTGRTVARTATGRRGRAERPATATSTPRTPDTKRTPAAPWSGVTGVLT